MKQIGINWKKLDASQQEGFNFRASEDMDEFDEASKVYKKSHPSMCLFILCR
jgi:hypothetical protein